MASVLDGVRVIDFGQYIAGPLTAMLLADQGADVIRVDPPGGPMWDTPANATWNRGKRSIMLNLKQPDDLAVATRLIASADVVIENFRPGVMDRLGLGPQTASSLNPRLHLLLAARVCVRRSARSGARLRGSGRRRHRHLSLTYRRLTTGRSIPPSRSLRTMLPCRPSSASLWRCMARRRDGVGQRLEVPLFDSTFPSIGARAMRVHDPAHIVPTPRGIWSGGFECADGRWVQFGGSGNQNFRNFVEAAGITAWDQEGLTDIERLMRDPQLRAKHLRRARALFKTRTAQDWEDLVARAGSECAVCRTSAEWFEHPHARASQMVLEVDDPSMARCCSQASTFACRGLQARCAGRRRSPISIGRRSLRRSEARQHARRRPCDRGDDAGGTRWRARAGPLHHSGWPHVGRTLAEFGADVIKIDNPMRGGFVSSHNDVNRGKRSLLLDLKSAAGRDVFWRLLEGADVVAQNYRAGKLDKLGLSYEDVRQRKPDIIYASLNAFGHVGPWASRPGH